MTALSYWLAASFHEGAIHMIEYHVRSARGRLVATFTEENLARAFILQQSGRRVTLLLFRREINETEMTNDR